MGQRMTPWYWTLFLPVVIAYLFSLNIRIGIRYWLQAYFPSLDDVLVTRFICRARLDLEGNGYSGALRLSNIARGTCRDQAR